MRAPAHLGLCGVVAKLRICCAQSHSHQTQTVNIEDKLDKR